MQRRIQCVTTTGLILLAAFAHKVGCAKRGKDGDAATYWTVLVSSFTETGKSRKFTSVITFTSVERCTHAEETSLFIISSFLCVDTHAHSKNNCNCDY